MMNIRLAPALLVALCFFCLGLAETAQAQSACFKCHDKSRYTNRVTHEPVAKDQCIACHNPHVARFKGLLQSKVEELCYSCHRQKEKLFQSGVIHKPVRDGKCLSCHDPHSSRVKGLLRGKNAAGNCFGCHKKFAKQRYKNTHKPFADGRCNACHAPHQSSHYQLLNDAPDALCLRCHKADAMSRKHKNFPGKLKDCLSCHNPHGSDRKALIRNVLHPLFKKGCDGCHTSKGTISMEGCLKCHEPIRRQLLTNHNHLDAASANSCTACHSPHASDSAQLLKESEKQVCLPCHRDTFARYENMKYKHPDVAKCSNCHAVHGSNHLVMLKDDGNAVCAKCHETQGKFTHPVGEGTRDPRTGQAVTCVSCHYPHGTEFNFNLKMSGTRDLCVQCHRGL